MPFITCMATTSEMTYIVSGGALNSTHSLTTCMAETTTTMFVLC